MKELTVENGTTVDACDHTPADADTTPVVCKHCGNIIEEVE